MVHPCRTEAQEPPSEHRGYAGVAACLTRGWRWPTRARHLPRMGVLLDALTELQGEVGWLRPEDLAGLGRLRIIRLEPHAAVLGHLIERRQNGICSRLGPVVGDQAARRGVRGRRKRAR